MIIFIYGQDTFRSRQYLKQLKDKFLREVDTIGDSLNIVDGATCNMEEISSAGGGASLFARKRMIVVEDLFLNKKEIILKQAFDFLQNKDNADPNGNIIIFWDSLGETEKINKVKKDLFNFLTKTKYSPKPFKKLSSVEIMRWITSEVQKEGLIIDSQAAMFLGNLTDNDLWQISNELKKIINYKQGQANISNTLTIEDIKKMVANNIDNNVFALIDAISNKNKSAALKLLEEQIEAGQNELQILSLVSRQFKILARIKEQIEAGVTNSRQIASTLKLHPYVAQKSLSQASGYTLANIKNILNKLIEMDFRFKKGLCDVRMELEMLILT